MPASDWDKAAREFGISDDGIGDSSKANIKR